MDIPLSCRCSKLTGAAANVHPARIRRIVCMCDDCQAYAHYLKREDLLDANGGTEVVPLVPAALKITAGKEHLRCLRLTGKGMYRWYAGCCNTPIANSMQSPKIPFAGVVRAFIKWNDADFPSPVYARVQAKFGIGEIPADARRTASFKVIVTTVGFLLRGWLRRQFRPSPFFDAAGQPVVEPYILTHAEREKLRRVPQVR